MANNKIGSINLLAFILFSSIACSDEPVHIYDHIGCGWYVAGNYSKISSANEFIDVSGPKMLSFSHLEIDITEKISAFSDVYGLSSVSKFEMAAHQIFRVVSGEESGPILFVIANNIGHINLLGLDDSDFADFTYPCRGELAIDWEVIP